MDPKEISTPNLVREYTRIKCEDVRNAFKGKQTPDYVHEHLSRVVTELRERGVLD